MRRRLLMWMIGAAIVVLVLPALKNLILFATYEHGNQALVRISGQPGEPAGVWEGTFDTYQCGLDERHHFRLTLAPDGTGRLDYRFATDRIGVRGAPMIYSWASLLPYDNDLARTYVSSVRDSSGTLVIVPGEEWFSDHREADYMAYRLRGDSLYIAYVNEPGEEPEEWGLTFSSQLVSAADLVRSWW